MTPSHAANGGRWKWIAGSAIAVALSLGAAMGSTAGTMYVRLDDRVLDHAKKLAKMDKLPEKVDQLREEMVQELQLIRAQIAGMKDARVVE